MDISIPTIADGLESRKDNFLLLRIIAALMVIYGHSFVTSPRFGAKDIFLDNGWGTYSGDIAVEIFFVVSGFMVSGSYIRRSGLFQFMKARVLRIVPALLACLLVSALVIGPWVTTLSLGEYFHSREVLVYIVKNLQFSSDMAWRLPSVFENNPYKGSVNGSLWTLPAEFRMYIFVAVTGAVGLLRSRTVLTLVLISLAVIGFVNPGLLPLHPMWVRLAGYFALGIAVQLYRDKIGVSHEAMVALAFMAFLCRGTQIYPYAFAIALTYFCFWFAYRLKLPSIEAHGDPSYGTYLWGWPLLQIFAWLLPGASPYLAFVAAGLGSLVLGYVSWHLVEKQTLRFKSRRPLSIKAYG